MLQIRAHPLVQPDVGLDTTAYVELARQILAGNPGLGPGLYYVSPLYIYFLAAVLGVAESFTAVRLIQAFLGTVSVGLIFLTARAWFGARAAWLAALLAGLTGLFTFYEVLILQASLDALLTSAALLFLTWGAQRSSAGWVAMSGLVFGLASLNRPNMLLAAAGVAIALLAVRRARLAVVLTLGIAAGLAPVAIRNAVVAREWTLVSSHGGLNFFIGNGEGATGFYRQVPGITPNIAGQQHDVRLVAGRALGRTVTDAEASDYFFSRAWTSMRAHPGEAAALFVRKLGWVFHAQHVALPHSYPFYAHDAGTALRFLPIGPWLLIPMGLVGLLVCAPANGRSDYLVWVSFVPAYAIAVALFFVAERYRLPLLVPLCIGTAAAIDRALTMAAERPVIRLAWPAALTAALMVAANWPHGVSDGRSEEGLRLAERLVIVGRYEEAEDWILRWEPRARQPDRLHALVGVQYLEAQQWTAAIAHLTRALELGPADPTLDHSLGLALLAAGRATDAIPHLRRGFDAGAGRLPGYDLAAALQTTGDLSAAADVIRRMAPSDETTVEEWLRVGRLAVSVRAPELAEPFFRRAAERQPDHAGARVQYGVNLMLLGRVEEAARELAIAVRLDPRDPDALANLAYAELSRGRAGAAKTYAEAALAIDPRHALAAQVAAAAGKAERR